MIEAYNSNHKHDFICISETYLDSSVSDGDKELAMEGYNFIREDHSSNVKKGGVGIYYKESIAFQIIDINFLSKRFLCEETVNNKKSYTAVLYRPPSQTNTVFNDFLSNFEKLLQELSALNPDFSIILGDFNARSKSRCKSYINTIEGTKIDSVTTSYGLQQLITQPTHLLANSSSCTDLIFTDQPSLIVDCGMHYCRADLFRNSFFLYTIVEWNKLDVTVRNAKSFLIFKNLSLKIGRPIQNSIFKIHDPLGIKLLTRQTVGLSHLNEHRFRHNFQDCLNPLCSCSLEAESNIHFFL